MQDLQSSQPNAREMNSLVHTRSKTNRLAMMGDMMQVITTACAWLEGFASKVILEKEDKSDLGLEEI